MEDAWVAEPFTVRQRDGWSLPGSDDHRNLGGLARSATDVGGRLCGRPQDDAAGDDRAVVPLDFESSTARKTTDTFTRSRDMTFRVFIAYSRHTPAHEQYIAAIKAELTSRAGIEVKYDLDIPVGDDWRRCLLEWMDEAHAVVALLSAETIDAAWVASELSIIAFRQLHNPDLLVIPIFVIKRTSTQPAAGSESYLGLSGMSSYLELPRLQPIADHDPVRIAAQVRKAVTQHFEKRQTGSSPISRLERLVGVALEQAGLQPEALDRAAAVLGWTPLPQGKTPYQRFARQCLLAPYDETLKALWQLAPSCLRDDYRRLLEILEMVASFWIPEHHAYPLAAISHHKDSMKRSIYLGVQEDWSLDCYVCRASWDPGRSTTAIVEILPPADEDTITWVVAKTTEQMKLSATSLRTTLDRRERDGAVVFLYFNGWWPEPRLLDQLRDEFKTTTFITTRKGTNSESDADPPPTKYRFDDVAQRFLVSGVGREHEEWALSNYEDIRSRLSRQLRKP